MFVFKGQQQELLQWRILQFGIEQFGNETAILPVILMLNLFQHLVCRQGFTLTFRNNLSMAP
jgi:hypothetical protein